MLAVHTAAFEVEYATRLPSLLWNFSTDGLALDDPDDHTDDDDVPVQLDTTKLPSLW